MSPEDLGELPAPPPDLGGRDQPRTTYDRPVWRVHHQDYDPLHFSRAKSGRFNDPQGEFGVLYAAEQPAGAFAERLLVAPGLLAAIGGIPAGSPAVSATDLRQFELAEIRFDRPLTCVDIRGPGLARIGADGRLTTGPHRFSRAWSRPLFLHPSEPDAILWMARSDPQQAALAIHERVRGFAHVTDHGALLAVANQAILAEILTRYNLVII